MPKLEATPQWLRANVQASIIGVDKEARRINGAVVAQAGAFKTPGRGSFDKAGLQGIVKLMKGEPNGLKSRLSHATLSDDGVSKFLGRMVNPRMDKAVIRRNGQAMEVDAVRADLQLSDSAFEGNPNGNIGQYVLNLAEEDPDALSSSLVLTVDEIPQLDKKGRPILDEETGEALPPIWLPRSLHGADVVAVGDAVDSLLSADVIDGLPDAVVRQASLLLNKQFPDATREVVEARCLSYLSRYLDVRFGQKEAKLEAPAPEADESEEAYMERCQAAGGSPEECAVAWSDNMKAQAEDDHLKADLEIRLRAG